MLCRTKDSPAGYVLLASPQYIDQVGVLNPSSCACISQLRLDKLCVVIP